jgi:hypothetical protein
MIEKNKQLIADCLVLAFITAVVFLQRYYVLSSDPLLAWPITDQIVHPEHYSSEDILVQAGVSGNFLLYSVLAYLPILRDNFPLRDFLIYVPLYFLTLYAWRKVFTALGANRAIVILSIVLLVLSDNKLGLNWAHVVPAYFISETSVQFLQVFGFLWFINNHRNLALGITAASGYFHPASALVFGSVYTAIIAYDAMQNRSWSKLGPIFLFIIIFLPNAFIIMLHNQGSLAASDEYFAMFERYQPQIYLSDHFKEGYAYTLMVTAFVYRYHKVLDTGFPHQRDVFVFITVGLLGSIVWLVNIYSLSNLQITQTFYVGRIFCLLQPLLIFLIVITSVSLYASSKLILERGIVTLFLLSPLLYFSPSIALIITVSCAAYAMGKSWWHYLFAGLIVLYLGWIYALQPFPLRWMLLYLLNIKRVGNELNGFQLIVLLLSLPMILCSSFTKKPVKSSVNSTSYPLAVIVCALMLAFLHLNYIRLKPLDFNPAKMFNFNPGEYWGIRSSDPDYAELIDWARQSRYKLFSVPPYDDRFLSFRYLSGKGVYIFHRDIAQLMYSPDYYLTGIHRLMELGGSDPLLAKSFMNGEVIRSNGEYESNCQKLIEGSQFDAIIFAKKSLLSIDCKKATPIFQNDSYLVFGTARDLSDE